MQYESLFEKSATLPQGCLTLQFVRCHHSDVAWSASDVAWSASDVEHLHELSVQYFRKHGLNENGRSVSHWIDCERAAKGLAVRVKTDKIALQPGRVLQYRLNLRHSVNKILKLRISSRLRNQSSSPAESYGQLLRRETSVVYVPVTPFSGLELFADFFLKHESDPERRRRIIEGMPDNSCIRIPSEPFQAVKMRVYGKGEPLLASVSGKDVSISFMTRKKAEQCGVAESTGQVEEFFPPRKQPEIEEIYRKTMERRCCRSDPPLEKDTGNPDVPPPVPDGTTSESTEKLGALSLLTASVGITPDVESKEVVCLPCNYRARSRSSVEPATVRGISSALEQSVEHVVRRGHQNTPSDSVAEKNTGNPNVPTPVLDGTIATFSRREMTEILGTPSLLAASAGITPNVESKKVDCLPLNSQNYWQSSYKPTTVSAISSAFKPTSINSRQSFYLVRSGNQNTLPNSVAEKNTGNTNVPHLVPDGITLSSSEQESTEIVGASSPISDSSVAACPPEQSFDVSFSIKKLLAARCLISILRSKKVALDSKDINTLIHGSVRAQVCYGTIAVSVPVRKEGRSIVCYIPSYDKDEVLRFIEYSPVNLIFTRMKRACSVLMALVEFHNSIVTKNDFEATQLLKIFIDIQTWNVLAYERRIDEASVIPELPKSSQQNHHGGILRAVAELSEIERSFMSSQNNRSEAIAATLQARVQKTDFVTVVEQRTMASTQVGLKRKRYEDSPTVVPETAVESPSKSKTITIESNTPDVLPTTKNNDVVQSSATNFDRLAPEQHQTATTTASSPESDGSLAVISRQPSSLTLQVSTRRLYPSRLRHLPIHCQPSYLCFPNSIKK